MTKLLELVFERATKLPDGEQDALAQLMLAELNSEREWEDRLGATPMKLHSLAARALGHLDAGRTEELNPDKL